MHLFDIFFSSEEYVTSAVENREREKQKGVSSTELVTVRKVLIQLRDTEVQAVFHARESTPWDLVQREEGEGLEVYKIEKTRLKSSLA